MTPEDLDKMADRFSRMHWWTKDNVDPKGCEGWTDDLRAFARAVSEKVLRDEAAYARRNCYFLRACNLEAQADALRGGKE